MATRGVSGQFCTLGGSGTWGSSIGQVATTYGGARAAVTTSANFALPAHPQIDSQGLVPCSLPTLSYAADSTRKIISHHDS